MINFSELFEKHCNDSGVMLLSNFTKAVKDYEDILGRKTMVEKPSFIRPLHFILEEVLSDLSQAILGNVNAGNWKRAEYIVRQAIQVRHLINSTKKDWEEFLKSGN